MSSKGLTSRIYEELLQKQYKINKPNLKMGKGLE